MAEYSMILTERQGRVAVIRLNRPQALNALCDQLVAELGPVSAAFGDATNNSPALCCCWPRGCARWPAAT